MIGGIREVLCFQRKPSAMPQRTAIFAQILVAEKIAGIELDSGFRGADFDHASRGVFA